MFAFIRGAIVSRQMDHLVVENQGIGYKIFASPELMARFPARGETALIHTSLYIREDQLALYGFPSLEDLKLFELLLTVSGVGPKVASAIVGTFTPGQFAMAVLSGDAKTLTQVRGIGRKGAERLILELKDKLKGADIPEVAGSVSNVPVGGQTVQSEAISALVVLGYSATEATQAVQAAGGAASGLEDLIRLALRQLMR
ncbi:MAG: Holliday junction branch migration protein RuvA [Eubacteriales bacterium]|nr:Holliday junction branch migration protein RuvA [Eubacteriales bacterium]